MTATPPSLTSVCRALHPALPWDGTCHFGDAVCVHQRTANKPSLERLGAKMNKAPSLEYKRRGLLVPEVGLEPTHLSILHFECSASANSATRARNVPP